MKTLVVIGLIISVLGGLVALASSNVTAYWSSHNQVRYREVEVTRGDIVSTVNASGTIQPVSRVHIGSFVSGPISELLVTYNDRVKEGQLLARFDPSIYKASVARDKAALVNSEANLESYGETSTQIARMFLCPLGLWTCPR